MAAPHVAGLVSLMLSINPSLTPAQVLTLLQQNVTPFPASGTCTTSNCGSGIANAAATLAAISVTPPADTQPNPFGWPTKTNVNRNVWVTSAPIVLTGFDTPARFAIDNGYVILNCGTPSFNPFLPHSQGVISGTVAPGTSVCVKHKSSTVANGSVTSSVTVGGVVGTFTSVTNSTTTFSPFR
jgi:hypothetical protein